MLDGNGTGGGHGDGHDIHREIRVVRAISVEPLRQEAAEAAILFEADGQRCRHCIVPAPGFHLNRN